MEIEMARHSKKNPSIYPDLVVQVGARRIAEKFGLDPDDVLPLVRSVAIEYHQSISDPFVEKIQNIIESTALQNAFIHLGGTWFLSFREKPYILPDARGLHYIRYLLRNPLQEISASALAALSKWGKDAETPEIRELEQKFGLGDAGEILDEQALREYQERVRQLDDEKSGAIQKEDFERAEKIENEIEIIKREVASAVGYRGRRRRAVDIDERARKAVSNRISVALTRIEEKGHSELSDHLNRSIRTGLSCSYQPVEPVEWAFEPPPPWPLRTS